MVPVIKEFPSLFLSRLYYLFYPFTNPFEENMLEIREKKGMQKRIEKGTK